ncbi:hypothetical protein GCM10010439_63410 [Actinocorallia aurantiaca]|uniref:Uncharacterized protein n=1 Tax=Actinocorallia aurantiaca TaxID=46204 RepID=A0ABP6H3V3_9ACTN
MQRLYPEATLVDVPYLADGNARALRSFSTPSPGDDPSPRSTATASRSVSAVGMLVPPQRDGV